MQYPSKLIGLALLTLAQNAIAADDSDAIRLIVKYKNQATVASVKNQLHQATHLPVRSLTPMAGGAYVAILDNTTQAGIKSNSTQILAKLQQNPNVIYAVKDRVGHFKPLPEPSYVDSLLELNHDIQWDEFTPPGGIMLESAPGRKDGAWAHTTGNSVIVAVLDTGIEPNSSLLNNIVKDPQGVVWGWNFAGNNSNLSDETGSYHGTHVAGTIAAYGDVITGVGEQLKILPVKIPDKSGMFYESQVINAIYWSVGGKVPNVPANPYPAKVLNMSFGVDERPGKEIDHCDEALQEAMMFARKKGAVVAAAAGNDNRWEHYNAPAVCNGAIKVASTGPEGLRAYYSNYGSSISFAAPGGDLRYGKKGGILSTVNPNGGYQGSGFDFYQGTSMASPHAAGVAALVFAAGGLKITPERVEQILYSTTHDFGKSSDASKACTGTKPCGHGILDANNAVKTAMANFDVIMTAPASQALGLKACGKASLQPDHALNEWLPVNTACQSEGAYARPQLQQDENGRIIAVYGAVTYRLNDSLFKHCEIIGFDGIGCYQ